MRPAWCGERCLASELAPNLLQHCKRFGRYRWAETVAGQRAVVKRRRAGAVGAAEPRLRATLRCVLTLFSTRAERDTVPLHKPSRLDLSV